MRLASLQYPGSGVIATSRMRSEDLVPAAHGALEADQLAVGVWRMCRERSRQVTTPAPAAPCSRIGGRIFDQPFRGQGRRDELDRVTNNQPQLSPRFSQTAPASVARTCISERAVFIASTPGGQDPCPSSTGEATERGERWKYYFSLRGPVGVQSTFRSMSRELYLSRSGCYI